MVDKEISYSSNQKLLVMDGKCIRSNFGYTELIYHLLKINNYTFDPIKRPVPAALVNWRDVERGYLVRLAWNVYNYFLWHDSAFDLVLSGTGFAKSVKDSRCYIINQTASNFERHFICPPDQLQDEIDRFFKLPNSDKFMSIQ